jgi:hypothetical protein
LRLGIALLLGTTLKYGLHRLVEGIAKKPGLQNAEDQSPPLALRRV